MTFYKTLIRGYFVLKKSVFMVLPTEYDIKIFSQSLSKGIENFTFFMHGGLRPKQILEKYKQIMNSSHGVLILGTAQYLSIPKINIGVIIVEHESSGAYKMISKPHFDLRIFAELYASKINAKFILSDTLLRYETIARKEMGDVGEVYPMSFRINSNGVSVNIINPKIRPEENRANLNKKYFRIFSETSIEEITNTLKNRKNVFIFSLRKGLATYTVCKDCNEIINCEKCLTPVTLYFSHDSEKKMFICNKCNTEKNPKTVCKNCSSWNLIPLGIGTDTVMEEIKNKFNLWRSPAGEPKVKIFKLDKESVKSSKEAEKIIKNFEKPARNITHSVAGGNPGSILIATEMAFFYLQEKVDLSVVVSFDGLWTIPNFKMSEKIIQLLLFILTKTEKKLLIQTKNANDSALLAVKSENLLSFVREELEDRKKLGYPPYKRFIKITYLGNKTEALKAKEILKEMLKEYQPEIFSGFLPKNKEKYITNTLIKIEPKKWSLPELSLGSFIDQKLYNLLSSLPPIYEVSVDPEDLL